jgi:hypothetical protein
MPLPTSQINEYMRYIFASQPLKLHFYSFAFTFILLLVTIVSSKTLSDTAFAFRLEIEPQWKLSYETKDTGLYYLRDETKQKKSEFDIRRIKIDTIAILEESEYAKLFFVSSLTIAHKLGTVIDWDSTPSLAVGNLRAYDLFAHYKTTKNGVTKWFVEYGRWCSQDSFLYEITIISDDIEEFKNNKQYYMSILNSIQVWAPGHAPIVTRRDIVRTVAINRKGTEKYAIFDVSGRKLKPVVYQSRKIGVSQCEIFNNTILIQFSGEHQIFKK